MSEIKTYTDYLEEVITGKAERLKCSGFLAQQPHETVDYEVHVGGQWFSYACPKCGFGTGGSISSQDRDRLLNAIIKKEANESQASSEGT